MTSFETRKLRNKQIFRELLGDGLRALETLAGSRVQFCTYASWLRGASNLAELLIGRVDCLKSAWDKGSLETALKLCGVGIQPMMSRWYCDTDVENQTSDSQPEEVKTKAFLDIQTALGNTILQDELRDVRNLNKQWNYEFRKSYQPPLFWYSHLLLSKAREAMGLKGFVNWAGQVYPVGRYEDIILLDKENIRELGIEDGNISALTMSLNIGYISMFRYFEYISAKYASSK